MLATRSPQMRKAVGVLKELSADEQTRMLYEKREMARRDIESWKEEKDAVIAEQTARIAEQTARIAEQTARIAEQAARIAEFEARLGEGK